MKETLICLVIGYINTLQQLDIESDDPQHKLNDELNRIGSVIESISKELGYPIHMDFSTLHWIHEENKETIIKNITEALEHE